MTPSRAGNIVWGAGEGGRGRQGRQGRQGGNEEYNSLAFCLLLLRQAQDRLLPIAPSASSGQAFAYCLLPIAYCLLQDSLLPIAFCLFSLTTRVWTRAGLRGRSGTGTIADRAVADGAVATGNFLG